MHCYLCILADGTDGFCEAVEVVEAFVGAVEGGDVLGPWCENQECAVGAGFEAAQLGFPIAADGVGLQVYEAQMLL